MNHKHLLFIFLSFDLLFVSCSPPPTSPTPVSKYTLNEKNFLRNKMFFLDTAYKSFYLKMRPLVPAVNLSRLQVWLSNDRIKAEARANAGTNGNAYRYFGPVHRACKLLKMGFDYALVNGGVIRFDSLTVITNYDWIGLHLETEDSAIVPNKGVYVDTLDTSTVISDTLWTLLPLDYDSTSPTFLLMWRNVYPLPLWLDSAEFNLRVTRYPPDSSVDKVNGRLFSEILGLTGNLGRPLASNSNIFDFTHHLLIIPPFDSTPIGNEPFSNPAPGPDFTDPWIYKMTGANFDNVYPQFMIVYTQPVQNK